VTPVVAEAVEYPVAVSVLVEVSAAPQPRFGPVVALLLVSTCWWPGSVTGWV
jgi:hypothetical protein